jgi:capsular exopolysaccharide synthesis family protein
MAQHPAAPTELRLSAVWQAIGRNWPAIVAVVAGALLCGVAVLLLQPRLFTASASVELSDPGEDIVRDRDARSLPSQEIDRMLQTQVDILASRSLAAIVWASLDPATRSAIAATGSDPLDTLQYDLAIGLPPNSRLITIAFTSEQPARAAAVANAFAAAFVRQNLQRKFDSSTYARTFLEQQLGTVRARLEKSDRALIAYARSADLLAPEGNAVGSLTSASLTELNQSYSQARATRLQAEQKWRQAQATPLMSLPEVLANAGVQQLTGRRAELEARLAEDLQRRRDEHPEVRRMLASIAELDRQIEALAGNIRASAHDQYLVAAGQERALGRSVARLKGASFDEQDRSVRYTILKREADTNRELYAALLQRFKELSARAGATNNNMALVDAATVPTVPVSPRPAHTMALAGVSGLILAFLLVGSRELFNERVREPAQIGGKLPLALLGVVPAIARRESAAHEFAEAHHALCAAIDAAGSGRPGSLLVTSSEPGEGKSTTALGLATAWASLGRSVLLIDADLRKPTLHIALGCGQTAGLSDVLAGRTSAAAEIHPAGPGGFDFLSAGTPHPTPAALLGQHRLGPLLDDLTQRFEIVILDGPPVLGLADAPRLAAAAGATIFTIEADRLSRSRVMFALARLMGARATMLGAVLTRFDAGKFGYGSTYRYDYGARPQLA